MIEVPKPGLYRTTLGHAARGRRDEESGLMRPGAQVQRLRAGDVALLKGKAWPGNERRGAVHRSPPASRPADPRLLLTLDPLG